MFTKEQEKEYLENNGVQCPVCKSENIDAMESNFDGDTCTQEVHCNNCDTGWYDVYNLVGIQQIKH